MISSNTQVERFLNPFRGDVRNNIGTFSQMLWEHDSEVFIFMARKAACLFDCLRELGIADVKGLALSDRVLDMDLGFLKGKRVTLVDDCVFTGTTLWNARNAVLQAGCSSFDTMALAVNIDSFRKELLPGESEQNDLRIARPVFANSDADCVRQCYDIVRAISIIPRPYDVDFPHSRTIKVKSSRLEALLNPPGWECFDVTSDFQRANEVWTFTLLPMSQVLERFCEEHSGRGAHLSAAKMRIYARRLSTSSYSVRLVPMVMFPAVDDNMVATVLRDSSTSPEDVFLNCGLTTTKSRYRLLHFIIAHAFLDHFAGHVPAALPLGFSENLRHDLVDMSFGSGMWNHYCKYWPDRTQVALPPPHVGYVSTHTARFDSRPVTVDTNVDLVSEAIAPFTWLYKERELKTRKYVKDNGLRVDTNQESSHINRLIEGFTPQFLFGRLQSSVIDIPSSLSILLDRFVDMGIAVPTIVQSNGVCCRAFRHGEDAVLGEAQERMLLQALNAYMEARNVKSVWGLELQKLTVLLVQIAIRNHLIDRINVMPSIPPNCRVLSIKGYLHGPLPTVSDVIDPSGNMGAPFIERDHYPLLLISDWVGKGYLKRHRGPEGTQYSIRSIPELSIGTRAEAEARQYGRCLGLAVARKALNIDREFVLLSTCAEPDHQLRALSGGISIFREEWAHLSAQLREDARAHRYADAHKALRSALDVFTAVNSGAMKFQWYSDGTFDTVIKRVETDLSQRKNEAMAADQWVLLWPQARLLHKDNPTFVGKTITDSGRWLFMVNVAMRLLDYWLVLMAYQKGQLTSHDVSGVITDVRAWIEKIQRTFDTQTGPPFVETLRDVAMKIDQQDKEDALAWCRLASSVLTVFARKNAKLLLDDATAIANAYGDITSVERYPYAVFFEAENTVTHSELILHKSIESAISDNKVQSFHHLSENCNPWRTGRWVLLPGNRNAVTAAELCYAVANRLLQSGIRFRAAVVGQLSRDDGMCSYKGSIGLRPGFFYERIGQLRTRILSSSYENSIGFANEYLEGVSSEGEKYARISGGTCEIGRYFVTLDDSGAPFKKFVVSTYQHLMSPGPVVQLPPKETEQPKEKRLHLRILLCTATDKEDDAMWSTIQKSGYRNEPVTLKNGTYRGLGEIGNADVFWVRSGMGSAGADGSLATTLDAIDNLAPHYVISCGLAFGANPTKQKIGDVLVSEWVQCYEKGKAQPDKFIPRGGKVPADPYLLQAARSARIDVQDLRLTIGGLLSGEKLVDDPELKRSLWDREPEAIGGEMEASGVLAASSRRSVRWIIVKAICDWGENKSSEAQPTAASNALRFVFAMINGKLIPVV